MHCNSPVGLVIALPSYGRETERCACSVLTTGDRNAAFLHSPLVLAADDTQKDACLLGVKAELCDLVMSVVQGYVSPPAQVTTCETRQREVGRTFSGAPSAPSHQTYSALTDTLACTLTVRLRLCGEGEGG